VNISQDELDVVFSSQEAEAFRGSKLDYRLAVLDGERRQCVRRIFSNETYRFVVAALPGEVATDGITRFVKVEGTTRGRCLVNAEGQTMWEHGALALQPSLHSETERDARVGDGMDVVAKLDQRGLDDALADFQVHDATWAKEHDRKLPYRISLEGSRA
jgi:hypothetical protein